MLAFMYSETLEYAQLEKIYIINYLMRSLDKQQSIVQREVLQHNHNIIRIIIGESERQPENDLCSLLNPIRWFNCIWSKEGPSIRDRKDRFREENRRIRAKKNSS